MIIYLKKRVFTWGICTLTIFFVGFSLLYNFIPKSISVFGFGDKKVPIYRVESDQKKISISFDAAWGADVTPKILEILQKYDVKTTFFLVDFWMKEYPEMTKTIAEQGHEIGNHSATHPNMGSLGKEDIVKEIKTTHQRIKNLTGQDANLFRPPFGDYSNTLIATCNELGYQVIQWDVDSLDWKDLSAQAIYDRVIEGVKPGSIVLFHNNGKHTAEALDMILKQLKQDKYEIVPISQLLLGGDYYIDKSTGEMRRSL